MPQRPAAVVPLHGHRPAPTQTIAGAVNAFLTQADLADATRREYGKYLSRLATRLGADRPLATITADELEAAITDLWGTTKPRTWNQRLAVVGSFLAFARRRGWPMAPASDLTLNLDRRRVKVDRTRVPTPTELERFWAKQNGPLVVKVFTRLQYETAARATELLSADIADLDMDNRRLRVTSKGGDVEWVYFQSGSARNLPRLRPGPARAPAAADVCPATGRVRISYRRMAELVVQHSGGRPTPSARRSSPIAGFEVESQSDMLGWLWIHFAIEAGVIASATKAGGVDSFTRRTVSLRIAGRARTECFGSANSQRIGSLYS